ncbi:malto-oligosyltrehalose trehalohydrolase [Chloroflexales bacterium ZM16-3]|nr:malto-oligosyltrehalose trehalohydrolase [Chloroflexales bacterium ZM16-3]
MSEQPRGQLPANDAPPGATYLGGGRTAFSVWAPLLASVEVSLLGPQPRHVPMQRDSWGYWRATLDDAPPGTRYRYRLDGGDELPDPASRHQPEGVHGPSAVVDPQFAWADDGWAGLPLRDYVIYELHVGAFTPEGTFDAIIPQLPQLKELGVTAIQLMPVAHFPGEHNWGYDGVYLYAPHTAYGGAEGLKRLVDACHAEGVSVILDVVYNHFGPEGNYLWAISRPFFTGHYRTPWGDAINYDGPSCDPVRHFIIANALYWLREFHIDALRLDAVHAIYDFSAYHLLEELAAEVHMFALERQKPAYLIAESDQNDPRLIRPQTSGGYGIDAQWADELHHAIHALLTGEQLAYFAGFGTMAQLATAYRRAFVFAGEYAPSRGRRLGRPPTGCRPEQFVVCIQNHDQVGNRPIGDRLADTLSFDQLKLAAGAMLLSPFIPLIFMGEEYAEPAPFQFFTDHGDPDLVRGVREGRKAEFAEFVAAHGQELPDPQDPATFARSKLDHSLRGRGRHQVLRTLYRELLRLRREQPSLQAESLADLSVSVDEATRSLALTRRGSRGVAWVGMNFGPEPAALRPPEGRWETLLDSADPRWADPAAPPASPPGEMVAPYSFRLLRRA